MVGAPMGLACQPVSDLVSENRWLGFLTRQAACGGAAVIPASAQADDAWLERECGGRMLLDALPGGRLGRVRDAIASRRPLALTHSPWNRPATGPGRLSDRLPHPDHDAP